MASSGDTQAAASSRDGAAAPMEQVVMATPAGAPSAPPGVADGAQQSAKRPRSDDLTVRVLQKRDDPVAAWQRAQAAQPTGSSAPVPMTLAELEVEVHQLQHMRRTEAEELTRMWATGNHNAQLLGVMQAEIDSLRLSVESLGVAVPKAQAEIDSLRLGVESLGVAVPKALTTVEDNDVYIKKAVEDNDAYIKKECGLLGDKLNTTHQILEVHVARAEAGIQELQGVAKTADVRWKEVQLSVENLQAQLTIMQTDLTTGAMAAAAPGASSSAAGVSAGASPYLYTQLMTNVNAARQHFNDKLKELNGRLEAQEQVITQLAGAPGCPCLTDACPCQARGCGGAAPDPLQGSGDAWANPFAMGHSAARPEGGPSGGGDGDGDGGGVPWRVPHFPVNTPPRGPHGGAEHTITLYSKPFDSKEKGELPHYDGKTGGAMWRRKVTNFFITRVPDLEVLLRWTESFDETITQEVLRSKPWIAWERRQNKAYIPGSIDAYVLGHHLWGFLNTNLTSDAWEIFGNVERSMGFEAWRRVVRGITKRSQAELLKLEDKVLSPTPVSKNSDLLMALVRWEGALKEYMNAGGEELSEKRRRGGVLRVLPELLREKVIWDLGEDKSSEEIIEWLRTRLRSSSSWGDGPRTAALIEDDFEEEEYDEEMMTELNALQPGASRDEMVAVFQRALRRRPGAFRPRRPKSQPPRSQSQPPRSREDVRCANCLKKGHSAFECREPRVAKRKCFECGEEDHMARNCPNKKTGNTKAANTLQRDARTMCVQDEDGFMPVQRRRAAALRPGPAPVTLEDYVPKSVFTQMEMRTRDKEQPEPAQVVVVQKPSVIKEEQKMAKKARGTRDDPALKALERFIMSNEVISEESLDQLIRVVDEKEGKMGSTSTAGVCSPDIKLADAGVCSPDIKVADVKKLPHFKVVSADPVASLPEEGRPVYRRTTSDDADSGVVPPPPLPVQLPQSKSRQPRKTTRFRDNYRCCMDNCDHGGVRGVGGVDRGRPNPTERTKTIVAPRKHALDDDGNIKPNVRSITEMKHADEASKRVAQALEVACGMNLLIEEEELNVAGSEEDEYVLIEIALDSGAGDHVMAEIDAPGYRVEESAGSKRGQNFVGAGGHRMPNKGQMVLSLLAPTGEKDQEEKITTIVQVADVTRPLWSVSKVCDAGYDVKFTKAYATVTDENGQPVCMFQRQGGLYVARMRLRNPKNQGFSRQGK